MTLLCIKYYQNWLMSVEDIANQSSVFFEHDLKRPIFGVYDSQGSAETLVRRGEMTNYHLIAYSFSNISAKIYQNRLMCIEVIAWNIIVVFLRHSVDYQNAVERLINAGLTTSKSRCADEDCADGSDV